MMSAQSTLRSMTGFGTAQHDWDGGRVAVSMRTVNHRFLDLVLKLPTSLRPLEGRLKDVVKSGLSRGRVEINVELYGQEVALEGKLDLTVARQLAAMVEQLESAGLVDEVRLRAIDFLRFPKVVDATPQDLSFELEEAREQAVLDCLSSALAEVLNTRSREGEGLGRDVVAIVSELDSCCEQVQRRAVELRKNLPARYAERLRKVLSNADIGLDKGGVDGPAGQRLLQEAGILAERGDVSEEVERLDVHLSSVRLTLERGGPCGRRLDFLAQEMLREFNTVAAKCRDSALAGLIVDAKVLCERFREQVQNIE